jgi:xylulokinase
MSLLGIDIGTSGCKSAIFSEKGDLLSLSYEEYDFLHPQAGWAELDTPKVWAQVKSTIRKAAAGARHDPVRGVCVSSMGEAVVPVTSQREILGASLLNFDVRGDEYLPELGRSLGAERLYQINGNTLGNPYSLTKLKWIKENQPELYRKAETFLHWSGFVSFMLGAEPHVDNSLANRTLLFDLQNEDWSDELLDWAGLDREKLPPTLPSGQVVGAVSRSSAEELGIPAGIPIVSGGHDQCCNAVGCGVIEAGRAMYGMGSYLCMVPVFSKRPEASMMIERGLNTEHHVVPGQLVSFIYNQGGVLVKWFRDTFAQAEQKQAMERGESLYPTLFAEMPEAPTELLILPHFTITGPPHFISDSSGVIAGLKLGTSRGEILKGIVESATFYLCECFSSLPGAGIQIEELTAAGGGSQSDAWVQLSADILGKPFVRLQVHEAGALGAAILAGTGSGLFPSLRAGADAMVHLAERFEPDPAKQRLYAEKFKQYQNFAKTMEKDIGKVRMTSKRIRK